MSALTRELFALAPADPLFEHGEGRRDEGRLKRALAEAQIVDNFDVIILDTPPSLDILLLNALTAANWVVVPFVPHPLSNEGVKQLMRGAVQDYFRQQPAAQAGRIPAGDGQ